MRWIDLELERNEASDLLPVTSQAVLDAHDWDLAYYVFLDEDHLEDSVGVLGHPRGAEIDEGWEHFPISTDCGDEAESTDDSEASARFEDCVYVIGSHFGKKAGPLQPARHWIARFDEDDLTGHLEDLTLRVHVKRNKLRLHRAINDALAAADHLDLLPLDERMHDAFIEQARNKGKKDGKKWAKRLQDGDYAMNVEGAAFRPNGNLLLGLRFPVSVTGAPVIVELAGVPESFEDDDVEPRVVATYRLTGPGSPDELVGFRAMTADGRDGYDVILGSLDATNKGSLLLDCYPAGADAVSQHWRFSLADADGSGGVPATLVRTFPDLQKIEGISPGHPGHFTYVVDEDSRVQMHFLLVDE